MGDNTHRFRIKPHPLHKSLCFNFRCQSLSSLSTHLDLNFWHRSFLITIIVDHYPLPEFLHAAKLSCVFIVALCYVTLASPPRHQHLRCFHYIYTYWIAPPPSPCTATSVLSLWYQRCSYMHAHYTALYSPRPFVQCSALFFSVHVVRDGHTI